MIATICKNRVFKTKLIYLSILISAIIIALIILGEECVIDGCVTHLRKPLTKAVQYFPRLEHQVISLISRHGLSLDRGFFFKKELIQKAQLDKLNLYKLGYLRKWFFGIFSTRGELISNLHWSAYIDSDAASLLVAMIYGNDDVLRSSVKHSFATIGMQHVMAASGFNVSLMLQVAHQLIGRFLTRRGWLIVALLVILWYGRLLAWPASLVRASVMASWLLFARFGCGRPIPVSWSLLLTVGTTWLVWPNLLSSIGWQLSFAATASLVLLSMCTVTSHTTWLLDPFAAQPSVHRSLGGEVRALLSEGFVTGLAVQVGTLPILWRHFGEMSWMGIPANAALVWLTPVLTTTGVYLEVAAAVVQHLTGSYFAVSLVAIPLGWLAEVFLWAVKWLSLLPVSSSISLPGQLKNSYCIAWWLGWIGVCYGYQRWRRHA